MKLFFETYGKGFPLIILHGLFGSQDNWQILSKRFGETFKVYAIDQRNHGNSPHNDLMSYPLMSDDLDEFMRDQNIPRAFVLGHSMGGKTAMQFALMHPEKVERLVVVDIAPKAYPPHHQEIFRALLGLNLADFQSRKEIEDTLASDIPELAVRQFLLKNVKRSEAGHFEWKLNLKAIYENYSRLAEALPAHQSFSKPTLFIKGERSSYILEEDTAPIRKIFPSSRIVSIPETGHWVHAQAPEKFLRLVADFLKPDLV